MQRNNNQRERKGSRGANIVYPIIHAEVCPGILELMEKGKLGQKKTKRYAIKHITNQGRNTKASTCRASGSLRPFSCILKIAKPEGVSNNTKMIPQWCRFQAAKTQARRT
jgi:hypothetical protein